MRERVYETAVKFKKIVLCRSTISKIKFFKPGTLNYLFDDLIFRNKASNQNLMIYLLMDIFILYESMKGNYQNQCYFNLQLYIELG